MSPNSQGIDTIELITKYEVFKKMADTLGLTIKPMAKSEKLYKKIIDEVRTDSKARRNKNNFKPIIEVIKLPKVDPKDKYLKIVIVRNTLTLFNVATHHKKAKDTFCMVTIAGLHQPTKKISSDAMKIISKFLKRKNFKLYSLDIAKDILDPKPIDKEGLEAFKERFKAYSNESTILPMKSKNIYLTSYYINVIHHRSISRIIYYDKYNKSEQNKENVSFENRHWKRLEVTLSFDVTRTKSFNFMDYIESMDFLDDFSDIEEMAKTAKIKNYSNDYLEYQINSFKDSRFMNNNKSKKQFNADEALEHFKESEVKIKYVLAI